MKMLKKIAIYEDRATATFIERYQLKKFDGGFATIDLPPSLATDVKSLRAKLLDAGTALASDIEKLSRLAAAASKAEPPKHLVYERQTGWIGEYEAFVLQSGLIGVADDKIIGIRPPTDDARGKIELTGKSQAWKESVAKIAEGSITHTIASLF
jgi:hypothetical protein